MSVFLAVVLIGCWDYTRVEKAYVFEPQKGPQVGFDPTGESNLVEGVYLQTVSGSYELVHEVYDPALADWLIRGRDFLEAEYTHSEEGKGALDAGRSDWAKQA